MIRFARRLILTVGLWVGVWALLGGGPATAQEREPDALVIRPLSGSTTVSEPLSSVLMRTGWTVRQADIDAAMAPGALEAETLRLVVLPDARSLPHSFHAPLERFLRRGGYLIAFGLPGWKETLIRSGDRWVDSDAYSRARAAVPPPHPITLLRDTPVAEWQRSSNEMQSPATYTIETEDAQYGPALHAVVENLTGWDTFGAAPKAPPFAAGENRTVFSAKGDANTRALAVEWTEKDGSRWIATIPLTTEWQRYELGPEAFRYWQSVPARGGRGDRFNPQNAERLTVGVAHSHTGPTTGRQEWWFAHPGTGRAEDTPLSTLTESASIDGLYPGWKTFRIQDTAATLHVAPDTRLFGAGASLPPVPAGTLYSPHPRPSGAGFDKGRQVRFVPLLEARGANGEWRGNPGALYVHAQDGRYNGGRWAVFGITDEAFLSAPGFLIRIDTLARRMRGPLLFEGGSDWYTKFEESPLRIGARLSKGLAAQLPAELKVTARITSAGRGGAKVRQFDWPEAAERLGSERTVWYNEQSDLGPWRITVDLMDKNGTVIDSLSHEAHVWTPPLLPQFVTTDGEGRFLRGGQPWKPHGVNYMPSSGIGRDHPDEAEEFEHWIGSMPYDPAIVGRDLDNIKRLGLNSVSIFIYGGAVESGNLLDILRQCRERDLLVNLSLRPGTPIDWAAQWREIRPIIARYKLRSNDTVFAYDLAWEPNWGRQEQRRVHDAAWANWVTKRYNSIESAETAWKFPAPRHEGKLTSPTDEQVSQDGQWRILVTDYRRFLGDLLKERYGAARREVRAMDPNHLVSFRMSEAGNPTFRGDSFLNYDFPGLAEAVDFLAPEAYGRIGNWENVRHGWFEVAYARAVAPALPVVWAEVGVSAWGPGTDEAPQERLDFQAEYFKAFYRMMNSSGSNGIYYWWYAGGYRTNENSDYGIVNPDGTDRPASAVIRENAAEFLRAPAPVPTTATIPIRLYYKATGLFGAYETYGPPFWRMIEQGRHPGLKIEDL